MRNTSAGSGIAAGGRHGLPHFSISVSLPGRRTVIQCASGEGQDLSGGALVPFDGGSAVALSGGR